MSHFEMKIETDNAAFEEDYDGQMTLIFAKVINQIRDGDYLPNKHSNIWDLNGNIVGTFRIAR